jgi:DNA polymerase-3 subunit delta
LKIAPSAAERFIKAPAPEVRAVLVYGPDGGLVSERVRALASSVVEDLNDPFRVAEFSAGQLRADPARLADEAAALSFTGGRRVVKLRDGSDGVTAIFEPFLKDAPGDALVLVEAGDLPSRSSLRKLFEKSPHAAALACYRDDASDVAVLVRETFAGTAQRIDRDAMAYLAANLGADRQQTRRELEKLALYMASSEADISLQDVQLCIGDNAALGLDEIALAVAAGDLPGLERKLARSLREGQSAIAILRRVAGHLQRLHLVSGMAAKGTALEIAIKKLRPPLFWKTRDTFMAQTRTWSPPLLAKALGKLLAAEAACKSSGQPADLLASRCLLEIAANAPRAGRRRP